jgi:hypothetical protein
MAHAASDIDQFHRTAGYVKRRPEITIEMVDKFLPDPSSPQQWL